MDINQRYDILGDRLLERKLELQSNLDSVKSYLQDVQDILAWLDMKEQGSDLTGPVPTNEKEACKKLKSHEVRQSGVGETFGKISLCTNHGYFK